MRLQEQGKTEQAKKDLGNSFESERSLAFLFSVDWIILGVVYTNRLHFNICKDWTTLDVFLH